MDEILSDAATAAAAGASALAPVFVSGGDAAKMTPLQRSRLTFNIDVALVPHTGGTARYTANVSVRCTPVAPFGRSAAAAATAIVEQVCAELAAMAANGADASVETPAPTHVDLYRMHECTRRVRARITEKYNGAAVFINAPPSAVCALLLGAQRERLTPPAALDPTPDNVALRLPPTMRDALKAYQREAVCFAVRLGGRCLIADEMGLGKTFEAIATYRYLREVEETRHRVRLAAARDRVRAHIAPATVTSAIARPPARPTAPATPTFRTPPPRTLLVVCPSSLRVQWGAELCRWLPGEFNTCVRTPASAAFAEIWAPGERGRVLIVMKASHYVAAEASRYDAIVVSYELASKLSTRLMRNGSGGGGAGGGGGGAPIGTAIVDESHMLKNASAQRTRNLTPLLQRIDHVLLLSGTPALARPKELYAQLSIIDPRLFPTFHEYGVRYCAGHEMRFTVRTRTGETKRAWDYNGVSNSAELNAVLCARVMVRRRKEDVLRELPSKVRERIFLDVPVTKVLERKMDRAREAIAAAVPSLGEGCGDTAALPGSTDPSVLEAYQAMAKAKVRTVCEYIEEFAASEGLADEGDSGGGSSGSAPLKILLFAHHRVMLDALEELVRDKLSLGYMRIDGTVAPARRAEDVRRFQEDARCRVALLSIMAAGTGLTLTRATVAIFAELNWTPGVLAQCEARAHRIGQQERVVVQYLIGKDTVEEDMWAMLERKIDVVGSVIDGTVATPTSTGSKSTRAVPQRGAQSARKRAFFEISDTGYDSGDD